MKHRVFVFLPVLALLIACGGEPDGGSDGPRFVSMGTAPVGGAFPVVGGAIAEVLNQNRGDNEWRVQPRGTKGSQENIRRLARGELQLALSNSAISYFAVLGESGWEQSYDIRAVATLAPNIATFVTKTDSGVESMSDLVGRRAMVGVAGAGFEMFVEPLLAAHGVTYDDFTQVYGTQSGAVDMLGDGAIDAAFLGGAVPTAAVTQACSTYDIRFVPFEDEKRQQLAADYPFFQLATIPAEAYSDLTEDYPGLNVGSMHLITSADADEELVYQLTKTLWENRESVAERHPAGRAINAANVARYTGTPFHPGAERYYREIGVDSPSVSQADTEPDLETEVSEPTRRTDIGTWVVTYGGIKITTTLYEEDGQPFMRQLFADGSQLVEKLTKRGDFYDLPGGEWFFITETGDLNLYDSDGRIWSARPQSG